METFLRTVEIFTSCVFNTFFFEVRSDLVKNIGAKRDSSGVIKSY